MPVWIQAGLWGLVVGGALVVGAAVAWFIQVPQRIVASVMAFGAGVLISALAFDLVDEAQTSGGLTATVLGFLVGAVAYVLANVALARRGAPHRKRSGDQQPTEGEQEGSGSAMAIGALLDGIPESVVLGLSLLGGNGVGVSVLAAIFISNLPEGLSSAAGMKHNGRSARYVFGLDRCRPRQRSSRAPRLPPAPGASAQVIAAIAALAAGAILTVVADTMIPKDFEGTHLYAGLIATLGFLSAFTIGRV